MLLKFWGVHGSLPRPGPSTLRYGGNTSCVEVRLGETLVIFDAGSGIRELGEDILRRTGSSCGRLGNITGHIFISHLHWDHIQGFPFFAPAYIKGNRFHLYSGRAGGSSIYGVMNVQMSKPGFPVALEHMHASLVFHDLDPGQEVRIDDAVVRAAALNHPGGSFGYRLEKDGKVITYATDVEFVDGADPVVPELARNADILIFDGMFTPEQYDGLADGIPRHRWGHSTWEGAVRVAEIADVRQLILFHHGNNDAMVREIEKNAQAKFPKTLAAYEGLEIEI